MERKVNPLLKHPIVLGLALFVGTCTIANNASQNSGQIGGGGGETTTTQNVTVGPKNHLQEAFGYASAGHFGDAIDELYYIPKDHKDYKIAQAKIAEYKQKRKVKESADAARANVASEQAEVEQESGSAENITEVEFGPGKKKVKAAYVDETIHLITNVRQVGEIGDDFLTTTADGKYVIIRFSILNDSNSTRTISASSMTLKDSQGREYQPSSDGQTALMMSGDKSAEFLMSQIQPSVWKDVSIVFETPKDATGLTLTIRSGRLFDNSGEATLVVRNP